MIAFDLRKKNVVTDTALTATEPSLCIWEHWHYCKQCPRNMIHIVLNNEDTNL